MTTANTSPVPRLLAVLGALALFVAAAVAGFRYLDSATLAGWGARLGDPTMTVLGWAPVGGLLVVAGLLALARGLPGGRSGAATTAGVVVLALLAGFAFPFLPARGGFFGSWRDDLDQGGTAFARAATWMTGGVALTLLWYVVLLALMKRNPSWAWTEDRFYAAALVPPSALVLVVLLLT